MAKLPHFSNFLEFRVTVWSEEFFKNGQSTQRPDVKLLREKRIRSTKKALWEKENVISIKSLN